LTQGLYSDVKGMVRSSLVLLRIVLRRADLDGLSVGPDTDAYVCMKFRFNGSWWDLCEEHFAEHPGRGIDDDDVVLLVSEAVE
jgi:hypothetical protein